MPEFAAVLNVSQLNGNNGFRLDGAAVKDSSGYAVGGMGDVDGDGFADLAIGAPLSNTGGNKRGLVWLAFGDNVNPAQQGLAARVAAGSAYRFQGETKYDQAGFSVDSAGDVNGDGFDDILIGAINADPDQAGATGAAYLLFGGKAHLEALDRFRGGANDNLIALANLSAAHGFRLDGIAGFDATGRSVSMAGDFDGDGFDDLIIGAPGANNDNGASFIVFGGSANLADLDNDDRNADGHINLSAISAGQGMRLTGGAGDFSGFSVAAAGDVNSDGFADVLVGAIRSGDNNEGAAYIVFGRPRDVLPATYNLKQGLDHWAVPLNGVAGSQTGLDVSGLGDINGDGFDDVLVGAKSSPAGGAYVVFGKSLWGDAVSLSALDGSNGFRLDGVREFDETGKAVSGAGDVNGDGFEDLLIGALAFDRFETTNCGVAFVVFGKASGFASAIDLGALNGNSGFRVEGAADGDILGRSVSAAGDVNRDGFDDIVVGAHFADNGVDKRGATYVIYGHRSNTAVIRIGTELANRINGGKEDDSLSGRAGNDTMIAWEGDDLVYGESGHDRLDGGAEDDLMVGGGGKDTLAGGTGGDILKGGSGADIFDYNALADSGPTAATRDRIVGFAVNADRIDLSTMDAIPGGANNAFIFRGTQAFTAPGQVRLQPGTDTVVEINTVGASGAEATILLSGIAAGTLDAGEFVL